MAYQALIPLAIGGLRSVYEHNKPDPTSDLQKELRKQAGEFRQESMVDTGGADAAEIENAIANQVYGATSGAVAKGRGSSPQTAANVARIASIGAGQKVAAKQRGRERSDRLRRTASSLTTQAEQLRSGFKADRERKKFGSLTGGAIGALGAYGAEQQQIAEDERLQELLSAIYGGNVPS